MKHFNMKIVEPSNRRKRLEKQVYMDAVWDYMLEHSDITHGGNLFVKFHTDSRRSFEKHVIARVKGYHRNDVKEKEALLVLTGNRFASEKSRKRAENKRQKLERIEKYNEIQKQVRRVSKINKSKCKWFWKLLYKIMP